MDDRGSALADGMSRLRVAERAENFPVALRVLPARRRAVLRAIYDVVRTVDDVGDEGDTGPDERLAALEALDEDLDRVFAGGTAHARVIGALAPHVGLLPASPFHDLVAANRVDQTVTRCPSRDELIGYCRLSAVPIGRLVLAAFEVVPTDAMLAESDDVCIALQLLEHLQDVGEDRARGRIYLPTDARDAAGVTEADLDAPTASPALRRLVLAESAAAPRLIAEGVGQVGRRHGAARLAVAGYAAGGAAAADALDRTGGDVLGRTCARTRSVPPPEPAGVPTPVCGLAAGLLLAGQVLVGVTRSPSSMIIRSAPSRPMPGTRVSMVVSPAGQGAVQLGGGEQSRVSGRGHC